MLIRTLPYLIQVKAGFLSATSYYQLVGSTLFEIAHDLQIFDAPAPKFNGMQGKTAL